MNYPKVTLILYIEVNGLKNIIAERIKCLREQNQLTQAQLARKLQVSRNCVNAWEMGISLPSTKMMLELSTCLHTSLDYLMGKDDKQKIDISICNETEKQVLYQLLEIFQNKKVK